MNTLPGLPGGLQMESMSFDGRGGLVAGGSLAQMLLATNFNVNALRTNAVLRKDEWVQLDQALVAIARQRLIGVADLMSLGLTYNLPNALGHTRLEWETISDMTAAEINMSGVTEAQGDRVAFALTGIPIPIIHKDFFINIRALMASRNANPSGPANLDTTQVALAGRLVSEKVEDLLFNGGFVAGVNGTVYGYTTEPNRNTGSVTASWALTATAGTSIVSDAIAMLGKAHGDFMFGPYGLYMPAAAFVHTADDYKTNSDRTILERLQAIPGFNFVKPSDNLSASNIILVQLTSDVVDMVDGIQPMVIQWDSKGGMQLNFKVMAILVPRIKADQSGKSGIVHYS
jgi:hypothetical protein